MSDDSIGIPELPQLGWFSRLFRSRFLLQYWLNGEITQVWVAKFQEKNDRCIIYQDYGTKRATIIKSDLPITYTLTSDK